MVYWERWFRKTGTDEAFKVTSDEQYLPPLRRRIVQECGREPDWDNESIYEHQAALDREHEGPHPTIEIEELRSGSKRADTN